MSSRALRKAQREKEELESAKQLQQEEEEDDAVSEDETPATKTSAFTMLAQGEDEDDDPEDDNRGVAIQDEHDQEEDETPSIPKPTKKKAKKKKKKAATKPAPREDKDVAGEDLDEIDQALKQLSTNGNTSQVGATVAGLQPSVDESNRLLAIDTSHLHAQNEMKRLFGRAALEQEEEEDEAAQGPIGGNRRQQRRVQQVGLAQALRGQGTQGRSSGLASLALRRNIFIQGKESWPIATGGGLGMEVEEKRADGTWLYRFVHNTAYQDVQSQFETCVESMDPNRLVVLLRHNPYHISTLLQVSEIAKQERSHTTAGDLLERALFSFGRALHSTFSKNLAEGKARLDFARPENREFWLAAWRYMQNLSMRGTWRTVYEWAKLLLSLSPDEDPYAMWLVLDQYALRARQDIDYLNISRNPSFKETHHSMPNVQLSQGLAELRAGNKSKGQQVLFTAISQYPWVVARLMQELAIDPPPAIWGKEPRTEREKLHTELYALRSKDVWNTPENTNLLVEVASAVQPEVPAAPLDTSPIPRNEARHVMLSDEPAFIALIPRHFSASLMSSSDPVPPVPNKPSYSTDRRSSGNQPARQGTQAENLYELQGLYRFFSGLFPWFNPSGQASETAGTENGRPSEEEIERILQESGVGEEVIVERTQRMMELQRRLMEQMEMDEAGVDSQVVAGMTEEESEALGQRARVEDVEDE